MNRSELQDLIVQNERISLSLDTKAWIRSAFSLYESIYMLQKNREHVDICEEVVIAYITCIVWSMQREMREWEEFEQRPHIFNIFGRSYKDRIFVMMRLMEALGEVAGGEFLKTMQKRVTVCALLAEKQIWIVRVGHKLCAHEYSTVYEYAHSKIEPLILEGIPIVQAQEKRMKKFLDSMDSCSADTVT